MPTVSFARSVEVSASPDQVWDAVTDVQKVAGWVGIVGGVEQLEYLSRYRAILSDRLGPFQLTADLDVEVNDVEEGSRIGFVADGEDNQVSSRILIEAVMRLSSSSSGTRIDVEGRYQVTGKVATLGASMIKSKGDKILEEFVSALQEELG